MAGMRREMYDDAQVQSKTELQRISPLRNSTPIGGMGIGIARAAENKPEPDARQALQNLSKRSNQDQKPQREETSSYNISTKK